MRRYVTTNYYSVRCNCGSFISPAMALIAIYTLTQLNRSKIFRGTLCVFQEMCRKMHIWRSLPRGVGDDYKIIEVSLMNDVPLNRLFVW